MDRVAISMTDRFMSRSLCGRPRVYEGRGVDQIVSDYPEPDPSGHAVDPMVATAAQAVPTFEDADPPFAPDAPALPAAEPALTFIGAPCRRFGAAPRQDHASHATVDGRLFVAGRAETAVARGEIRRAAEDRLMAIQRRGPQRDVGRAPRMNLEAVTIWCSAS